MQLMYDIGARFGQPKNRFRLGFEYQFWNNKFGNTREDHRQSRPARQHADGARRIPFLTRYAVLSID
jgi:hypothetical protein